MYSLRATIDGIEGSFLLDDGPNPIGRSPDNKIVLDVSSVSRRHAVLHVGDVGLTIEDLGSLNGTYVDDRKIDKAPIYPEARLRLAGIPLVLADVAAEDAQLAICLECPELDAGTIETEQPEAEESTLYIRVADSPNPQLRGLRFPESYCPGRSPGIQKMYRQMRAALRGERPVLILGETGVGKEMVVEALHRSSRRQRGPLVAVNCAAIPDTMLEAELFGIGKGVATGVDARSGRFREAAGGTLFLDEIGEMPLGHQAKLLRVLQFDEIQPVGRPTTRIDVRVIAATNADMQAKIDEGSFRADLYYRLAANFVEMPPLRRCREDIPRLVEHFLREITHDQQVVIRGVTTRALQLLTYYGWPGNIRQLEHEIHRLVGSAAGGAVIQSSMLPEHIRQATPSRSREHDETTEALTLEPKILEIEESLIREALRRSRGKKIQAAELLGISRNGLAKKMKRLGIESPAG